MFLDYWTIYYHNGNHARWEYSSFLLLPFSHSTPNGSVCIEESWDLPEYRPIVKGEVDPVRSNYRRHYKNYVWKYRACIRKHLAHRSMYVIRRHINNPKIIALASFIITTLIGSRTIWIILCACKIEW